MIKCLLFGLGYLAFVALVLWGLWRDAKKSWTQCPNCEAKDIEYLVKPGEKCIVCGWENKR